MKVFFFLIIVRLLTLVQIALAVPPSIETPNIILILADDMGYGDVGCCSRESRVPTPHMDGLAAEGVRLIDAHSADAVWTPSRYALMTGRYCWRTRLTRTVLGSIRQRKLVATELLGRPKLEQQAFENTDGTPLRNDEDYFGNPRVPKDPLTGSFELPATTRRMQVWPSSQLENMGLAELAQKIHPGFLMGVHTHDDYLTAKPENKKYQDIIKKEFNLISVGIYQKRTQARSQSDWDFSRVDPAVEFADQNNVALYAHPLFGSDGYIPPWLLEGNFSNENLLDILEDRVQRILGGYRGSIDIIDVYNEGFYFDGKEWREKENLLLSLGWHENEYGRWPIFLEKLLVWARKYGGEGVKLVYNQNNNTLYGQPQSEACIELHTALRHAGIPIDGIGIQLHTHITKEGVHQLSANDIERPEFDTELFAKNLKAMADSGIDVYITECDVHLYGEHNDAMLKKQADAYVAMLQPCLEASNCKSFKTWGLFDGSCWKPLNKNNPELVYEPYPLLFDHELNPKPAYYELKDMMIELIENNAGQNKR